MTQVPGYVQLITNYHGRVGATDTPSHNPNYRGNFAMSYVTGAHAFKTGFDLNGAFRWANNSSVVPYSYVVSTLADERRRASASPAPDDPDAALGRLHRPAAAPGQRHDRRRQHLDPAGCPTQATQQGDERGRRVRAGQVDD